MLTWEAIVHNLTADERATYTVQASGSLAAEGEALRLAAEQWPDARLEVDTLQLIDGDPHA